MDPVVSAEWLKEQLGDPQLIILDSSQKNNISGAHTKHPDLQIKGARSIDFNNTFFSDEQNPLLHMLAKAGTFERGCQVLGINSDSKIVVYDNLGIYSSPRVWWMFRAMGHHQIAVLDGGLLAWINSGFETEQPLTQRVEKGDFKANYQRQLVSYSNQMLNNIEDRKAIVIDARSADRFNGIVDEPRKELVKGHIPGSINISYESLTANNKFLPKQQLKQLFQHINTDETLLIFSCGSGVTACITMLAAELVLNNPKSVYDGSWAEWGQEGKFPISTLI